MDLLDSRPIICLFSISFSAVAWLFLSTVVLLKAELGNQRKKPESVFWKSFHESRVADFLLKKPQKKKDSDCYFGYAAFHFSSFMA